MPPDPAPNAPDLTKDVKKARNQKPRIELPSEFRSRCNANLPDGIAVAVNVPHRKHGKPPAVVLTRLPRSSSGRPPRRPVFVPLPRWHAIKPATLGPTTPIAPMHRSAATSQEEPAPTPMQAAVSNVVLAVEQTASNFFGRLRRKVASMAAAVVSFGGIVAAPVRNVEVHA